MPIETIEDIQPGNRLWIRTRHWPLGEAVIVKKVNVECELIYFEPAVFLEPSPKPSVSRMTLPAYLIAKASDVTIAQKIAELCAVCGREIAIIKDKDDRKRKCKKCYEGKWIAAKKRLRDALKPPPSKPKHRKKAKPGKEKKGK